MASRQVEIVDNRGNQPPGTRFGGSPAAGARSADRPRSRGVWRGLVLLGVLGTAASARAASPAGGAALLNQRLDWDGAATAVTVLSDGTVTIQGQGGAQAPLTIRLLSSPGPAALRSARAELASGGETRYLIIRAQAGEAQRLAVVGKVGERLTAIYSGPVGPVGRDGEYSLNVEATPQGLLRYQRAPGVSRCDGEDRLFIERYQGAAGWRAAPELGLPELGSLPVLTPTTHAPAALPGSPIGVYRFVAASAQVGVQRADLLAPPHELEDGKPATAWRVAADARGASATARADGTGHQVQALRFTPAPASQGALPRQLALIFGRDAQQRLVVNLSPATRDGLPQWVQLPTPVTSSCLSLVITQPDPGGQPMALGKVAIFSELDADQSDAGLRRLAERAASADFTSAEAALRTLRAFIDRERSRATPGRAALLQAIAAVLPGAQGAGRRRLHEALRALAGGPAWPELGQTLVGALLRAEPEERPTLWAAAEQLGPGAEPVLLQLAREPRLGTPGRSEVFKRLGALATPTALQALLELTATDPPPDRALQRGLRDGLLAILHCRAVGDPLLTAALRALGQPGTGALSQLTATAVLAEALGQALAGCEEAARTRLSGELLAVWQQLGEASSPGPTEQALFTLRYRILQSLERLAVGTAEVAALLQRVLATGTDPVLRQAAARAAVASAATAELSRPVGLALADADPGVRLAVLSALQERHVAQVLPAIEQVLRSDRWPGVRRAALESRAAQCPLTHEAVPPRLAVLRQAVGDADEQVQRLALAGLGRCEGAGALDVYAARLKDADAAPALRSQACALLVRHGFSAAAQQQQQAHATVAAALSELLSDPAADERSAGTVISCARAIGELGDARDLPVLMQTATASASEVPPPIRQSALESIAKICGRGPALPAALRQDLLRTFQSAAKDPEGRVQAAAQRAQARCR